MYQIIKDSSLLGLTDAPVYVKRMENGCFGLCPAADATGVVWGGTVYHMADRPALEDAEDVLVVETDAGVEIRRTGEVSDITFVTMAESGAIDDVTAGEHAAVFAAWAYPIHYKEKQIRRHGGKLYRCLGDHTSQETWAPDVSPSLWVAISDPAEEWPAWSQPVAATDAYTQGAKVTHNGTHWTSDVDNNVWEPGVYGWSAADE